MSKTSIIRADPPEHEKPAEGVHTNPSKLLPALLIPARPEAKEPTQQHQWHPGTGLGRLILAPSDPIITFYYNPSYLVPRAMILDHVLGKELAAWLWVKFPNTAPPSRSDMFPADQLLTLLTNFTCHEGTTADRDRAKDALHAVCIQMLEEFETPTTYRSKKVEPSYYCRISFTLLHYENRLFQLPSQTNNGAEQQVGRLSSWSFHQGHVVADIYSLSGEPISRHLSWQQACDLASMLTGSGPIFKREVTANGQPTANLYHYGD